MEKLHFMGKKKEKSTFITITSLLMIMVCISFVFSHMVYLSISRTNGITIVIDAGHGARDGGSVGANGTIEKDINLRYAMELKDQLVKVGYYVEMTRKNDEPLYNPLAKNKKLSEMQARMNIIKRANPNLVISVHMNSFPLSTARGATAYYRKGEDRKSVV